MLTRLREGTSPALVLSVVALFVALGGGAYAAKKAGKNTVVAKSIKAGAVKNPKLAANAVTSDKIADGAVATADIAGNAVTSAKIADGTIAQADVAPLVFTAPSLLNSWTQSGFTTVPVGFAKDIQGIVHLRGAVGGGTTPFDTIFVLPEGFRPASETYVPAADSGGGNDFRACVAHIEPNGNVELEGVSATDPCSNVFASLEGVTFLATQ